ncbi:hypothetical protein AB0L53_46485 [Nonomuraea sp. NPDC052129]|uniref:hypothetical protein n=1 Tax=Nonomuraea sp. NPDC052129 TaxID=3154651 RepID=UPI0034382753
MGSHAATPERIRATAAGGAEPLRLGGFNTEANLTATRRRAVSLDIPEAGPDGHQARTEILDMIKAAHKKEAPLPDYDELRRKYNGGQRLSSMLFGDFFESCMAEHERTGDIRKTTLMSYRSHYKEHLKEVLAQVRMDRLWVSALQKVFTRIDEKNAAILKARASEDPALLASVRGRKITGLATKQRIRATLSTVLSDAVRQEIISVNNAGAIKLDKVKRPKALGWTKQRVETFNAKFAERLAAVRAEKGSKKISAVRVWETLELRPSPVMVWTPIQLGAFLDVAAQHRLGEGFGRGLDGVAGSGYVSEQGCGVGLVPCELVPHRPCGSGVVSASGEVGGLDVVALPASGLGAGVPGESGVGPGVGKPIAQNIEGEGFAGTLQNGVQGSRASGCSEAGDSGGPIFTIQPDGYIVAKGILSGGASVLGLCRLNFTDIQDVRRAFGGDVMKRR